MHPLETRIGYKFRNSLLLAEALTHSSLSRETRQVRFDNQRLEHLGDAVIQLLFSEYLFTRFPDADEGRLTKARARLVSGDALAVYAQSIQLGAHLMMGRSDEQNGGRERLSTLADAFEALVGAIYLDGGLPSARAFMLTHTREQLARDHDEGLPKELNSKGCLQEILQALPALPGAAPDAPRNPTYRIVAQTGPDHAKCFTAEVCWNDRILGCGHGTTKQLAEFAAASDALLSRRWEEVIHQP